MQRRVGGGRLAGDVSAVFDQKSNHRQLAKVRRDVKRRVAGFCLRVDVGAVGEQNARRLHLALLCAEVQRHEPIIGCRVGVGAALEQQRDHLLMARLRGEMNGREAGATLCVHIHFVRKQRASDLHLIFLGGDVQRLIAASATIGSL